MSELERLIFAIETDPSLADPRRFRDRLEALDRLDAYAACVSLPAEGDRSGHLHDRTLAIAARLEALNARFYESIRSEIRTGAQPAELLAHVGTLDSHAQASVERDSYDYLDELLAGVLALDEPAAETADLEPDMVFYQPTPARHIFDLIGRAGITPHDVLIDLGSGLGHVALLVSICTRARAIGIEREGSYVASARECASALDLHRVVFHQQDVRSADLSDGTVFFLYTPFTGNLLRQVLGALHKIAARRAIRICTYGPCTLAVAQESWLETRETPGTHRVAVFRSRV